MVMLYVVMVFVVEMKTTIIAQRIALLQENVLMDKFQIALMMIVVQNPGLVMALLIVKINNMAVI